MCSRNLVLYFPYAYSVFSRPRCNIFGVVTYGDTTHTKCMPFWRLTIWFECFCPPETYGFVVLAGRNKLTAFTDCYATNHFRMPADLCRLFMRRNVHYKQASIGCVAHNTCAAGNHSTRLDANSPVEVNYASRCPVRDIPLSRTCGDWTSCR